MNSQKVLVAGTGVSGIAAAKLLLAMGGDVILYDSNEKLDAEELKGRFEPKAKLELILGECKRTDLLGVELCIISPGIPLTSPLVKLLDDAGIPIWGELQLAYHCSKGRLAAITGTNGKTTTTALTGQILKDYFDSVFVVGNIGTPYSEVALETEDSSVTVAEVSSFQLETIMDFHPQVSAILNITPDHLNRHGTMEQYIAVKKTIAMNQTAEDTIVLNYDDPVLRSFGLKEKPVEEKPVEEKPVEEKDQKAEETSETAGEAAGDAEQSVKENQGTESAEQDDTEKASVKMADTEAPVQIQKKPRAETIAELTARLTGEVKAKENEKLPDPEPSVFELAMQENKSLEELQKLSFVESMEDLGAPGAPSERSWSVEQEPVVVKAPSVFDGNYTRPETARPEQARTGHTGGEQARTGQTGAEQARAGQTGAEQAGEGHTGTAQTGAEKNGSEALGNTSDSTSETTSEKSSESTDLELKAKVIFFSSTQTLEEGLFLDGDLIIYQHNGKRTEITDVHDLKLLGKHNYENVMAAAAIALSFGVPLASIQKTLKEFQAVEHRIEFVRNWCGVNYYNDSKATNPDAAIQAVRAMPGPTILIAGGSDKNNQYDEWIESFGTKIRYMVLIGQTRDKIAQCAREHFFYNIMYAEDMQEAVRVCASYANIGENVLLSPACASFGMFKNYEERGRIFKECVLGL